MFKQLSLQIRVFGYPSTTQFDRDSFLLFVQNTDLKVLQLAIPLASIDSCNALACISILDYS